MRTLPVLLCGAAVCTVAILSAQRMPSTMTWTRVTPLSAPATAGASDPHLVSDGKGRAWLSWLEPGTAGATRFRVARVDAGGVQGDGATIAEGPNFFVNWADVPAIFRASNGTLVAHWLERRGTSRGAYDIKLAASVDGGIRWKPAGSPHRDGVEAEHGFVSFFMRPGSADIGLIWLDGRRMAGASHDAHGSGDMATELRATALAVGAGAAASLRAETVVDPRVCDCCSTSAATTADGVIVAYRDRSDAEVRDISVSRFDGTTWSAPATVNADNWEINACPVNGPVVTANGRTVAVAWYTQGGGTPHTRLAFSRDGGRTFGAPIQLDGGTAFGRLAMAMPSATTLLVAYIERNGGDTALWVRQAGVDGTLRAPVRVAAVSSERATGFPRLAVDGSRAIVAWTEAKSGKAVGLKLAALK